jgi:hypothetical protein
LRVRLRENDGPMGDSQSPGDGMSAAGVLEVLEDAGSRLAEDLAVCWVFRYEAVKRPAGQVSRQSLPSRNAWNV